MIATNSAGMSGTSDPLHEMENDEIEMEQAHRWLKTSELPGALLGSENPTLNIAIELCKDSTETSK
jgi:hypothetical protein